MSRLQECLLIPFPEARASEGMNESEGGMEPSEPVRGVAQRHVHHWCIGIVFWQVCHAFEQRIAVSVVECSRNDQECMNLPLLHQCTNVERSVATTEKLKDLVGITSRMTRQILSHRSPTKRTGNKFTVCML